MSYYAKRLEIERRSAARSRRVGNVKLAVCAALIFVGFAATLGSVIDGKFVARCESGAIASELCAEVSR